MHLYTYAFIWVCIYMGMHVYGYAFIYVYLYMCIYICVFIYVIIFISIFISIYLYVYMCIYSKLQKLWHKTYQHMNISRPLYFHFILTLTASEDAMCFLVHLLASLMYEG